MRAAVFPTFCLIAACARPDYSARWPDRFVLSAGPQPGYAIKQVVEKLGSPTLLGDDGSLCRDSKERFTATRVGSWINCVWSLPVIEPADLSSAEHRLQQMALLLESRP